MRILMVTSEWPTPESPNAVPFIVRQVDFLRRAGVDVDVFHFRGGKNLFRYMQAWGRFQSTLRRGSYDLVHAQFGQSGLLALFPKRLPLLVTFRGDDLEGIVGDDRTYLLAGKILRQVSRFVAWRADAVILVSQHLSKYLSRKDFTIIPSGLDLALFRIIPSHEARQQLGLPADKTLVLFVGDPAEVRKRFALAQAVVNQIQNAQLVVGWGVAHAQIPLFMNACDAMIFTSMHEGSPNVVKEALACNLPVVSVEVGDVRKWLSRVDGCIVCEDDQPATLTRALTEVLQRKARVEGRQAIMEIEESQLTQKVIQIYEKLCSNRK